MSRLGKLPIQLPAGTQVKIEKGFVVVKGPLGELKEKIHESVSVDIKEKEILISVANQENKKEKALWGLFRALINNMVMGVNKNFERKLELNGVGYRVAMNGNTVVLNVGFSHPVEFKLPAGIIGKTEGNSLTLSGIDKQLVGEMAAQIRRVRKPEPYKGKGIKYSDEVIRRKAGKTASK